MKNNVKEWEWPERLERRTGIGAETNYSIGFNDCLSIFNQAKKDGKLWVAVDREELAEFFADYFGCAKVDSKTDIYKDKTTAELVGKILNWHVTHGLAKALIERLGGKR